MIDRRNFLLGAGAGCGCVLIGTSPVAGFQISLAEHGQGPLMCVGADSYQRVSAEEDFKPAPEAAAVIQRMAHAIGLDVPITVGKKRNVPGSAYAKWLLGELIIVYDSDKFDFNNGRISWFSLFVFAHELGHHIAHPQVRGGGSTHHKERAADRFAGAALGRLGASLDQALTWARTASEKGSKTHPPRAERIAAVEAGWYEAQDQLRWQNAAHCKPDWLGEDAVIGGETCRIARQCGTNGPRVRLACETAPGRWNWR